MQESVYFAANACLGNHCDCSLPALFARLQGVRGIGLSGQSAGMMIVWASQACNGVWPGQHAGSAQSHTGPCHQSFLKVNKGCLGLVQVMDVVMKEYGVINRPRKFGKLKAQQQSIDLDWDGGS